MRKAQRASIKPSMIYRLPGQRCADGSLRFILSGTTGAVSLLRKFQRSGLPERLVRAGLQTLRTPGHRGASPSMVTKLPLWHLPRVLENKVPKLEFTRFPTGDREP